MSTEARISPTKRVAGMGKRADPRNNLATIEHIRDRKKKKTTGELNRICMFKKAAKEDDSSYKNPQLATWRMGSKEGGAGEQHTVKDVAQGWVRKVTGCGGDTMMPAPKRQEGAKTRRERKKREKGGGREEDLLHRPSR